MLLSVDIAGGYGPGSPNDERGIRRRELLSWGETADLLGQGASQEVLHHFHNDTPLWLLSSSLLE